MNVEGVAALDGDGATQVILTTQGRCLLAERAHLLQAALDDRERDGRVDADDDRQRCSLSTGSRACPPSPLVLLPVVSSSS
jgi:hypothetical protein